MIMCVGDMCSLNLIQYLIIFYLYLHKFVKGMIDFVLDQSCSGLVAGRLQCLANFRLVKVLLHQNSIP